MNTLQPATAAREIRLLLLSSDAAVVASLRDYFVPMPGDDAAFSLTSVATVRTALAELAEHRFDLIVFDLGYANPLHFDILRQIAEVSPRTAILALAAEKTFALSLRAVRSGAQDLLAKNRLSGPELRAAVHLALARRQNELSRRSGGSRVHSLGHKKGRRAAKLHARSAENEPQRREADNALYMIAHDLKQPLSGIRGLSEMLREDYAAALGAEGRDRLVAMGEICDRLAERINDLMTLCRIDRQSYPRTTLDLNAVLNDVLKLLQPEIQRRRAIVRVENALPQASGNATLIGIVLSNLIVNGMKFNDCPEPRIEIGAIAADPPTLYVKDNGIGIPEKHFSEIFMLFRRLHSGREYEGNGAGLAIVRKILDAQGGRIWLDSTVGVGTTFYVALLPAQVPDQVPLQTGVPPLHAPHWIEHAMTLPMASASDAPADFP